MSEQYYQEGVAHWNMINNWMTFICVLTAISGVLTAVSVFTPKSKVGKWLAWGSVPTAILSVILAVGLTVWPPARSVATHDTLKTQWAGVRSDARDLYLLYQEEVGGNIYSPATDEEERVPDHLVDLLRILNQKRNAVQDSTAPSAKDLERLYGDQTERMWGNDIRSEEALKEFLSTLTENGAPIPAPKI